MILVTGGSGRLGSLVVGRLLRRGLPVRVLTRDPARAAHLRAAGVEIVLGDVTKVSTLAPAVAGSETIVSAAHGFAGGGVSPASVDRDGNLNLIDAAGDTGAAFVLMSVVGASPNSSMELFRMKHAAEEHLRASAVPWTVVRSTAFLETWTALLQETARRSGRPLVFGRGDNPINFVPVAKVADAVERAVTDPSVRYSTLEVGGPDDLTLNQLAMAVQSAAGRAKEPRHVPRPILRLLAATLPRIKPELARQAQAALAMDITDLTFKRRGKARVDFR